MLTPTTEELKMSGLEVDRGSFHLGPVDITVSQGQVIGLVGHNGSGKTTLYNLLSGLLRPTAGAVTAGGKDNRKEEVEFKRNVVFVSDSNYVYGQMSVDQALRFAASFHRDSWDHALMSSMLTTLRLPGDRKVKALSKGMKTKLAIIIALAARRPFMVLDEPTSGLDLASAQWFWKEVHRAVDGGTGVFLSLHNFDSVVANCHAVVALEEGCIADTFDLSSNDPAETARLKTRMTEVG